MAGRSDSVKSHSRMTQIPGARHSTSTYQGHGVDEPEALQKALRRSLATTTGQLLQLFPLTGTRGGSNPPPRSSHNGVPLADHDCEPSPCVGTDDSPETLEGYFVNDVFQGRRPVPTGCPLSHSHAAGLEKPRQQEVTNNIFAATDYEVQSRGSFGNDVDHHHDGKVPWGDNEQWVATTTLARECREPLLETFYLLR
jgi:hypothetical protein